jgi:bacillithiol system protein YtxJ
MTELKRITSSEELAEMIKLSTEQPVLFFKHSNTCGISSRAYDEFQRYLQTPASALVRNCLIVVQTARPVSNELARLVGVNHESPQAIIVQSGRAAWHESHLALKSQTIADAAMRTANTTQSATQSA